MIVDNGIVGKKPHRPLHRFDGLLEAAKSVEHPGKAVDDITRFRITLRGAFDHLKGLIEALAPLHQRIAQVVENLRLFRVQNERLAVITLRFGILAEGSVTVSARVEDEPKPWLCRIDKIERGAVAVDGLRAGPTAPPHIA